MYSPKVHTLFFQRVYVTYYGQLKRIDAVHRSPIYAHCDESVAGATSIRAYNRKEQCLQKCDRLIDESQRPFYLMTTAQMYVCVNLIGICLYSVKD